MHHWSFVIIAYAITLSGTAIVSIASYRSMRVAESNASEARDRP